MIQAFRRVVRPFLIAVASLITVLFVLVAGLSLWSLEHQWLRLLGPAPVVFVGMFILIGAPAFVLTAVLASDVLDTHGWLQAHLISSSLLYLCGAMAIVSAIGRPVLENLSGGDIALRMIALLMMLSTGINAWVIAKRRRP